jgi:surface antigen
VLVWSGGSTTPGAPGLDPEYPPLVYTPLYLTEKILASRSTLEGERKQITVLFADLKGSTDLIAGLDPEEARQLLDPALQAIMKDYQVVEWRFKNGSVRAAQSLRIPYYFTDEYGQTVKDYVLIGFEGAGGE